MNRKFVSLKSVLADLSTTLPEQEFNEYLFYEWAAKGLNKIRPHLGYCMSNALIDLDEHVAALPSNFITLKGAGIMQMNSADEQLQLNNYLAEILSLNEPNNRFIIPQNLIEKVITHIGTNRITVMQKNSSTLLAPNLQNNTSYSSNDKPVYNICAGNILMSNVKKGLIIISYLSLPTDAATGDLLIPDDEDLKQAVYHYCMYRYYEKMIVLARDSMMNHYKQERMFHLSQFQTLALKSKNLELPDEATLENLVNIYNRNIKVDSGFESFYSNINDYETIRY